MNPDKTGGTAFPISNETHICSEGMTLRQYYAAKVMQAFISNPDYLRGNDLVGESFHMADEMIKFEQKELKNE